MATVYYPSFDCVLIDADGVMTYAVSETIDAYNVTAASSLGTIASDTNGIVAAGSFTATAGDVVEFSHGTYPETFRVTLAATQALAYTIKGNNITSYVMENLQTKQTSTVALLYAGDNDNPNVEPVLIGSGQSGETVEINYSTTVAKNLRIYARSQNDQQIARTNFDTAAYDDVTVPGNGVFTYGSFALNDNADNHKLTVRVAENLSADRILSIVVNDASRVLTIAADATISGTNTGDTITIGTTPIASGTNNRVLYQASGVVSQSANLTFDGTKLSIIGTTAQYQVGYDGSNYGLTTVASTGRNTYSITGSDQTFVWNHKMYQYGTTTIFKMGESDAYPEGILLKYIGSSAVSYLYGSRELQIYAGAGAESGSYDGKISFFATGTGKVGIGMATPAAKFDVISTSEQLRIGYDSSNYLNFTIGSTGIATIDGAGSANAVKFATGVDLGFFGATPVTQRSNIGAVTDNTGGTAGATINAVTPGADTIDVSILHDTLATIAQRLNRIEQVFQDTGMTS